MTYLVTLAVIVAFLGFAPPKYGLQQNNYKNYLWICGVLVALISALRTPYTGSIDSYRYKVVYEGLQNYEFFKDYYDKTMSDYDLLSSEAGFYYVMWLFGHVFKDGQMAFVISSVLTTAAVCYFIHKNSADVPLSLTIYICLGLFTFNMNGMRQAMAMSICLFAYEFAKDRKFVPFVLTVLLAMLFHKTAMCFFPVYFLPVLKNDFGSWAFYICGLVVCLLFIDRIIEGYYEISGEDYSDTTIAEGGGLFVILLYVGTFALTLYKMQILKRQAVRTALLATLVGFVSYIARFVGSGILERISYYYFYFPLLLIPEAFQELDDQDYKFIKLFFVLGCVLLFAYRTWNGAFKYFTLFFV